MNKRKTPLEKLLTGARFEGVKPNIPRYKPTASSKLVRRLNDDDVDIEKLLPILAGLAAAASAAAAPAASAVAGAAGAVAGAVGSVAGAVGGALARGASAAGRVAGRGVKEGTKEMARGTLDAASGGEAPVAEEVPEATPPPQEEPEDEMEAEAQQAPTKRDKAVAELAAMFNKAHMKHTPSYWTPTLSTGSTKERGKLSERQKGSANETWSNVGLLGPKRIDWKKKEHTEPTSSIEKEGDGGGDGGAGALAGGGTVFTSTNAGIFTPTHGGSKSPHKEEPKKKKTTGIERLGRFLTDGSPVKLKDVEKSNAFDLTSLLNEIILDLRKEKKQVPYGSKPTEDDPPQVVERYNPPIEAQEPKKHSTAPKSDEEIKRAKIVDENKQRHAGMEEPYGMQLQQWGSGPTEVDSLKRGGDHDILTPPPDSDENEQGTTIPKDPDLKLVGTKGYEKYLKNLQKMKEEGDEFPLLNAFWKMVDDPD